MKKSNEWRKVFKAGDGKEFFETYASEEMVQDWKRILQLTRVRWNKAAVGADIIKRYLNTDEDS